MRVKIRIHLMIYEQLRTEIMHLMEERTRRIEEKIDRLLTEHKKMELI